MKILLVKLSALGDVVQSLPVAMAIRRQLPDAQLDWVVEPAASGILAGHPALSHVLVSPRGRWEGGAMRRLGQVWAFRQRLQATRYDAVLDLQGLIKSGILVSQSRGARKIGFAGGKEPAGAVALTEKLPPYDPERHALLRYLDLLEPLGLQRPARVEYGLEPTPEEESAVDGLLAGWDQGRPLVLLHPVALWDSKLWPVEHWVALAGLLAEMGLNLGVTGSAADGPWARRMAEGSGAGEALRDFTGRTSLRQLAALMRRARLVVCTDTGAMHLAAAVGAPVSAIFGPTAPWRTGPFGPGHRVVCLGLDCSPCFRRQCDDPRCMRGISPQSMAQEVAQKLSATPLDQGDVTNGPE